MGKQQLLENSIFLLGLKALSAPFMSSTSPNPAPTPVPTAADSPNPVPTSTSPPATSVHFTCQHPSCGRLTSPVLRFCCTSCPNEHTRPCRERQQKGPATESSSAPRSAPQKKGSSLSDSNAMPRRKQPPVPAKWWAVTRVAPGQDHKLGLMQGTWGSLQTFLGIRGGLGGSGYHAQSFATEIEAARHWEADGWELPAPLRNLA